MHKLILEITTFHLDFNNYISLSNIYYMYKHYFYLVMAL